MTAWFADTYFFLALLIENDESHSRAVTIIDDLRARIFTTTAVLTEVADALASPDKRDRFLPFLEFLETQPLVEIVPMDRSLFDRSVELYHARSDKYWSLTDCISFVVMDEHDIRDALTGDRHFEQAGFVALMQ